MVTQTPADVFSEEELRELVPQLQQIADKYKRKELIQQALFQISELSSSVSDLTRLYRALHEIIGGFMSAQNFYVVYYDDVQDYIDLAYFIDEHDTLLAPKIPTSQLKKGRMGYIFNTGESLFITQENCSELLAELQIENIGTDSVDWMGVPLKRGDKVIGAMVVQSYDKLVRYSEEDIEVLQFVSQHIVTSIDRVKNREYTERTIRERTKQLRKINDELQEEIQERQKIEQLQRALFDISELSASFEENMDNFYSKVHLILARLVHAPNCYIATINETGDTLEFPYFSDERNKTERPRSLRNGLTEFVLRQGEEQLVSSTRAKELADLGELDTATAQGMRKNGAFWMGAPLLIEGAVSGAVGIQSYDDKYHYTPRDLEILRYVSHHIAVALERKHSAEAIQQYNLQLAEKVKERTEELHRANASLKQQIEERKQIELKLIHDAHHDNLTGLPNRALFTSRVELAVANKIRYPQNTFAVLFIDLDRFKLINDTLGHQAGDLFLIEVSKRISRCIREHDLLARLGGDEFVILLDNFEKQEHAQEIASRILNAMNDRFNLEGNEVYSGGSIGIAFVESTYLNAGEVIRDADAAMYQAKSLGRGRYVMFDQSMRERFLEELEMENEFRKTLKNGEFDCLFQPVVELTDKDPLYVECYVRWEHSRLGKIKREQFWKVAEHVGMTIELDRYMLERACDILNVWQSSDDPKVRKRRVAINLSMSHLIHARQITQLIERIEQSEIEPDKLVIEIDETHLNVRSKQIFQSVHQLKAAGLTLVLDNFGNGMASLTSLCIFPFDYVKIERKLVQTLPDNAQNLHLVQSIQQVSENFGFEVIINGIETEEQRLKMLSIGCTYGQGRHLAKAEFLPDSKSVLRRDMTSPHNSMPPSTDPDLSIDLNSDDPVSVSGELDP